LLPVQNVKAKPSPWVFSIHNTDSRPIKTDEILRTFTGQSFDKILQFAAALKIISDISAS